MRVLQIGSDRSKQGVLVPHAPAWERQRAYAEKFGALDLIGYSLRRDGFARSSDGPLSTCPTNAPFKLLYGTYALLIARTLPRPDVVSAQDPHDAGLLALWIARWKRVPLHVQVHSDVFTVSFSIHSIANFIRLHISLYVLKKADGIRVVSERSKKHIETRLTPKRPITVLPIFVDIARFKHASAPDELKAKFGAFSTKLLFVGRLEAEKNASLAIESFAKIAPYDACLIIVGNGSQREMLEALALRRGVRDRVFFEGEMDSAPYYALADLVLVTSDYEGYGRVIVEALASGKPVLSRNVGIAREAGAVIAEEDFAVALKEWFASGPRSAELKDYPYRDFEEYVKKYCDDIARLL